MNSPKSRFKPDCIHNGFNHSEHRRLSLSASETIMAFCLIVLMAVIFVEVGVAMGRKMEAKEKANGEVCFP